MVDPGKSRVLLGRIGPAHGIRGEVVIQSFAADPAGIAAYGPLSDEAGARLFELKIVRVTPKGVIACIKDVPDRTAAEKLRGIGLYVDRDRLPEPDEDEFYHTDLIGLTAVSPDGDAIGEIISVENYGAGDLLEIRLAGSSSTALVPFADPFVPSIDLKAGRATVVMPPDAEGDDGDGGDVAGEAGAAGQPKAS